MKKYVVLLIVLTLATIPSAHADQSTKPLAMTVNVTATCEVSIANNIPEHSVELITEALAASGPVRERCAKRAVWMINVDSGSGTARNDRNTTRDTIKDNVIRVTINF